MPNATSRNLSIVGLRIVRATDVESDNYGYWIMCSELDCGESWRILNGSREANADALHDATAHESRHRAIRTQVAAQLPARGN